MTGFHAPGCGRAVLALVLLLLLSPAVGAGCDQALPWRILEFERASIWGNASSRIELEQRPSAGIASAWQNPGRQNYLLPSGECVREITVAATVGSNQARLQLLLEPASSAILQRDRLTIGSRDRRSKFYRYHRHGVTRIRRDPGSGEADLPPAQWSRTSLQELTFPQLPADSVVTTPYALLILTSSLPLAPDRAETVYVHTDFNLYRVRLRRGQDRSLRANYQLHHSDGQSHRYKEDRPVETIHLQVEATAQAPDKPDFELLGLSGELTVLIDAETRMPLRVIGSAPRIGATHLDLKTATLPIPPSTL